MRPSSGPLGPLKIGGPIGCSLVSLVVNPAMPTDNQEQIGFVLFFFGFSDDCIWHDCLLGKRSKHCQQKVHISIIITYIYTNCSDSVSALSGTTSSYKNAVNASQRAISLQTRIADIKPVWNLYSPRVVKLYTSLYDTICTIHTQNTWVAILCAGAPSVRGKAAVTLPCKVSIVIGHHRLTLQKYAKNELLRSNC